jgi:A/G-specific adenine glycosylase
MTKELHDWFLQNRRDFPWRESPTPYKVWISEVMLQQTRASVVIPYFLRWIDLFPTARALAEAPLEKVIKAWEGLGYYSRARNLHRGAQQIVERFGGEIPSQREELESIHGLGPYTVGAILSFGFKQRAPAVDGNVTRVLTRYFSIEENISKQSTKRKITAAAESLLDKNEPWVTAEALIELGATICSPKPRCHACPLQRNCLGQDKAESLPIKNEEKETIQLKRTVVLIECSGKILVKKGEKGKVMADLYEFPYFEMGKEHWTQKMIVRAILQNFNLKVAIVQKFPSVAHTFTRFKAQLYPVRCQAANLQQIEGFEWVSQDILSELPFSAGHRRILSL